MLQIVSSWSRAHQVPNAVQRALSYTSYFRQALDGPEWPVLLPMLDDRSRFDQSDARKLGQFLGGCCAEPHKIRLPNR